MPSVAILGTDAILAALPATAVQLAHACMAAGYSAVIPASWGDELVAEGCLRHLASRDSEPAIMCACPLVAARLQGSELAPLLVPLVPPPVACARYVRAVCAPEPVHLTYIGACPSAADPALDAHLPPAELLARFAALGIVVEEQPVLYEAVLPPDRRRFYSLPGGVPAMEWLAALAEPRVLVELDAEDCRAQLAEQLLSREQALIDLAPRMGCACSGAVGATPPRDARAAIVALEPPRASGEVLDTRVRVDVERSLPPRPPSAALDISAAPDSRAAPAAPPPPAHDTAGTAGCARATPTAGVFVWHRHARARTGMPHRPATVPVARAASGHVLPRAYLGHRRPARRLPVPVLDIGDGVEQETDAHRWASQAVRVRKYAGIGLPPQGAVADPLTC